MQCNVICTHTYSIPENKQPPPKKKRNQQLEQNSCPPNVTASDKQLQNTMALLKLKAPRVSAEHIEVVSLRVTPTKRHTEQNHSSQPADRQPKQSVSKKSVHNACLRLETTELWSSVLYGSSWLTLKRLFQWRWSKSDSSPEPKAGL